MTASQRIKFEINLPAFNKFLFCIPLRGGLVICSIIQLLAILLIAWRTVLFFAWGSTLNDDLFYEPHVIYSFEEQLTLLIFALVVCLLDSFFCLLLTLGALKKNVCFLKVCYRYINVKIWFIFSVILLELVLSSSRYNIMENWYDNVIPWTAIVINFSLFGLILIALNIYLLLLERSYLIKLDHLNTSTSSSNMFTNNLYQHFSTKDPSGEVNDKSDDTKALSV